MSNMILTLPNSADLGLVTAGSATSGYPATNLQLREPAVPWRSATGDILPNVIGGPAGSSTYLGNFPGYWPSTRYVQYSAPSPFVNIGGVNYDHQVLVVALANDTSRPISGNALGLPNTQRYWRVRAYTSGLYTLAQITRPAISSTSALTNLTFGGLASNDIWLGAPDHWLTATVPGSPTQVTINFAASQTDGGSLPYKVGANLQTFLVYVAAATGLPTMSIDLMQGGTFVANLASGISVGASGALYAVQWNASLLSGLSAQNVGLRITSSGAGINVANAQFCAEHNGYTYDSGALQVGYPLWAALQTTRSFNLAVVLPSPITLVGWGQFATVLVDNWSNVDTYCQAGRLIVANGFQPTINMDYGWSITWVPTSIITRAVGGQIAADVRPSYRLGEFPCNSLQQSEAYDQLFNLQGYNGVTGDMLWIPDPANTGQYYNWVLYGRLQDLSPVINPRFIRFTSTFKFEEYL